ncbi:arsenate reductase family protein [Helicobacter pametensis]|uniref:arsenate reductase family protein n=1 Tax=Helicobacter pametensis TaxID=95149 RepID=UPI0004886B14|nr:arsenate reductase family protein [Helicobacter pametensis]
MIQVWGIKNCTTVKKALCFLDSHGLAYEFYDYKKLPPSLEVLRHWCDQVGIDAMFNAKSATYRQLNLGAQTLSIEDKLELMSKHPTLIKRPILQAQDLLFFGFSEEKYETLC